MFEMFSFFFFLIIDHSGALELVSVGGPACGTLSIWRLTVNDFGVGVSLTVEVNCRVRRGVTRNRVCSHFQSRLDIQRPCRPFGFTACIFYVLWSRHPF